jgi:hypothetical protein
MHIIACFSYKLSIMLNVPQNPCFTVATQLSITHHILLIKAIQHQDLIGWNMFLRGFTSRLWFTVFSTLHDNTNIKKQRWDVTLVYAITSLVRDIRSDRNNTLHGTTKSETTLRLRERLLQQTRDLYATPPGLTNGINALLKSR